MLAFLSSTVLTSANTRSSCTHWLISVKMSPRGRKDMALSIIRLLNAAESRPAFTLSGVLVSP